MALRAGLTGQFHEGDQLFIEPVYQMDFTPEEWSKLQPGTTDCYGYVLGLPFVGVNGLGSLMSAFEYSSTPQDLTPSRVAEKLHTDGLQKLNTLPRDDSHVIAVFYSNRTPMGQPGIHCYCRNSNGLWSHLHYEGDCNSADATPTQTDFSGNIITDPQEADTGCYDQFIGYFAIPYEGIVIRPKLSMQSDEFPPLRNFTIRNIPS